MQPEERFLVASISDDRGTVVDSKNLTSTRLLFPATSYVEFIYTKLKPFAQAPRTSFIKKVACTTDAATNQRFPSTPAPCILIAFRKSNPGMTRLLLVIFYSFRYIYWALIEFFTAFGKKLRVQGSVESVTSKPAA